MKEIADDQGKQVQQLAALERVMKKQERETRAERLVEALVFFQNNFPNFAQTHTHTRILYK